MDSVSPKASGRAVYVRVFLALALITAVEVALSSLELARQVLTPLFLVLSLGKAALVAAFYMHLRSDARVYTLILLVPAVMLVGFALLMLIG